MEIILLIYVLISLAVVRPIAGSLAYSFKNNSISKRRAFAPSSLAGGPSRSKGTPDIDHWIAGYVCALCICIFWPLLGYVMLTEKYLPKMGAEKQAELERREKAIREAERELGMR